jgi:hypothetical protein
MAARKVIDGRPGSLPEIHTAGDSVKFIFDVEGRDSRLIIRCDAHDNVYVLIPEPLSGPSYRSPPA